MGQGLVVGSVSFLAVLTLSWPNTVQIGCWNLTNEWNYTHQSTRLGGGGM